jgi:hypothetical protein
VFSGGLKERGIDDQFCIHLVASSRGACSRRGLHRDPFHQQLCLLGGDCGLRHSRGPRTQEVTDPSAKAGGFSVGLGKGRTQGRLHAVQEKVAVPGLDDPALGAAPCWCRCGDKQDRDAGSAGFVGNERLLLPERPGTKPSASATTGPDPSDRIDCLGHDGLLNETRPVPARIGKLVPILRGWP